MNKLLLYSLIALLGIVLSVQLFVDLMIVRDFENLMMARKRPDLMEVVKKVDDLEKKEIEVKTQEIKKNSVKLMLSPLIIKSK